MNTKIFAWGSVALSLFWISILISVHKISAFESVKLKLYDSLFGMSVASGIYLLIFALYVIVNTDDPKG